MTSDLRQRLRVAARIADQAATVLVSISAAVRELGTIMGDLSKSLKAIDDTTPFPAPFAGSKGLDDAR